MRKIIAMTIFAASTFVAPSILSVSPASAAQCGVDAPAGWERPGGFCELMKKMDTLASPIPGLPGAGAKKSVNCVQVSEIGMLYKPAPARARLLKVAAAAQIVCDDGSTYDYD